jgi:hypothetical protein
MDWIVILQEIFDLVLIPLLAIIAKYFIQFVSIKMDEIKNKQTSEEAKKYLDQVEKAVENCVVATNQTYVESLKNKNAFDAEAQKEAFRMTYEALMATLTVEAKEFLAIAYGDMEVYLKTLIEAKVNTNKIVQA